MTAERVLRTYLTLVAVSTGASSMIWGINTLFLLDAGLNVAQAFAANAFFTVGMVLFEVPTGVVADTIGRRASYLLGTATLIGTTLLYLWLWRVHAGFGWWAVVSGLLGLGFTFFSGATEAWLVDGLHATGYEGSLDAAFAKGQVANGVAMMAGSIGGGVLAQVTNLGMPYVARAVLLVATFAVAWRSMRDIGFTPKPRASVRGEMTGIVRSSLRHGLLNPRVRWVILAGPFTAGVNAYGFYAAQPYLLHLYGHTTSYAVAGLSAGVVAAAQIAGGLSAPHLSRLFTRTHPHVEGGRAAHPVAERGRAAQPVAEGGGTAQPVAERGRAAQPVAEGGGTAQPVVGRGLASQPAPERSGGVDRRVGVLMGAIVVSGVVIAGIGVVTSFWAALVLLMVWGTMFAAMVPVRQAYLNSYIPSEQRATVLSLDNLVGSAGGVVVQPALGRAADVWGFGPAYLICAAVQVLAVPVLGLARRKPVEPVDAQPLAWRA
ncbi:MFS family permease [Kribbella aluminosa]|uniref:MFS family permease n=1 Tax=Kribbella aluminosa TaxID=416017 RepID=A0ABS4UL41_9ACTN|nr:MFS transporter [Kribbella aluminosa]MBP2352371.1 MFS family permease [Kribbella aluminosa]